MVVLLEIISHSIKGFHCNIETFYVAHDELWDLYHDLKLARQLHISSLLDEVDSLIVVNCQGRIL